MPKPSFDSQLIEASERLVEEEVGRMFLTNSADVRRAALVLILDTRRRLSKVEPTGGTD